MDAIRLRAASGRWRSWLALSALVGIFGGAVVAAAAGTGRTDSVVDRYVDKRQPPNDFATVLPLAGEASALGEGIWIPIEEPQVKASVAWQATTLAGAAVLIGIPLGIVAGRALWRVLANDIGVVPRPRFGLAANLLLIPLALVLANLIALWPGRSASRTQPAVMLRTE